MSCLYGVIYGKSTCRTLLCNKCIIPNIPLEIGLSKLWKFVFSSSKQLGHNWPNEKENIWVIFIMWSFKQLGHLYFKIKHLLIRKSNVSSTGTHTDTHSFVGVFYGTHVFWSRWHSCLAGLHYYRSIKSTWCCKGDLKVHSFITNKYA